MLRDLPGPPQKGGLEAASGPLPFQGTFDQSFMWLCFAALTHEGISDSVLLTEVISSFLFKSSSLKDKRAAFFLYCLRKLICGGRNNGKGKNDVSVILVVGI